MHRRCRNPNDKRWSSYGGRGITVCSRWKEFALFLADMGVCSEGMSLERRNNDGPYAPWNCHWIPMGRQAWNRRNVKLTLKQAIEIRQRYAQGKCTQKQLAELYEVDQALISKIIQNHIWQQNP